MAALQETAADDGAGAAEPTSAATAEPADAVAPDAAEDAPVAPGEPRDCSAKACRHRPRPRRLRRGSRASMSPAVEALVAHGARPPGSPAASRRIDEDARRDREGRSRVPRPRTRAAAPQGPPPRRRSRDGHDRDARAPAAPAADARRAVSGRGRRPRSSRGSASRSAPHAPPRAATYRRLDEPRFARIARLVLGAMVEVALRAVRVDLQSRTPVLVLQETGASDRRIPIFIGEAEAVAIECAVRGVPAPRPLTHDLLEDVIDRSRRNGGERGDHRAARRDLLRRDPPRVPRRTSSSPPGRATPSRSRCAPSSPLFVDDQLMDAGGPR